MAGPPNTVAISAPIPTQYFASASGPLAALSSAFQQHGHVQPPIPVIGPGPIWGGPPPILGGPIPTPVIPTPRPGQFNLRGRYINIGNAIRQFSFTNPLSYWQRQIGSLRFGRSYINGGR